MMSQISEETNYQKIQKLFSNSDLSKNEQDDLLVLLLGRPDDEIAPLAELFAQDRSWIRKIFDNYKAKQDAFAQKDRSKWDAILTNEESIMQDMIREEITT